MYVQVSEKSTNLVFDQNRATPFRGSDLSLGMVCGRVLSGDWDVLFR